MGFIVDGAAIFLGGIIGGSFRKKINIKNLYALSIGIMLISLVGLLENILTVSGERLVGEHTVVVTIALVLGSVCGDLLRLEDRLHSLSNTQNAGMNGLIDATLFFGVGGLQISGPILFALQGDSFQLILKGVIDLPFALMLGAAYGRRTALSAFPVAAVQLLLAALAFLLGDFMSQDLVCQLCSLGYLILFFSGFNMLGTGGKRIKNINMLPGMLFIILYNFVKELFL